MIPRPILLKSLIGYRSFSTCSQNLSLFSLFFPPHHFRLPEGSQRRRQQRADATESPTSHADTWGSRELPAVLFHRRRPSLPLARNSKGITGDTGEAEIPMSFRFLINTDKTNNSLSGEFVLRDCRPPAKQKGNASEFGHRKRVARPRAFYSVLAKW